MNALRLVFAGTPEFAVPSLKALADSPHTISAVYTQPDRPAGRGKKLQSSAVKQWANANAITVYQPVHFKTQAAVDDLKALAPDLMVVIAYGLILPSSVLSIPRLGCINVHASLLPRWRGASPIQQTLLQGDTHTGITLMQMDAGMDTGDILAQTTYLVAPCETAGSLQHHLAHMAVTPLLKTLDALSSGEAHPVPQAHANATYAPKISKQDARINWHDSALHIARQIRAFNPWPIAYTHTKEHVLRIHEAQILPESHDKPPGTILSLDKTGMLVATGKDQLLIKRFQYPGGKVMTISDWLNAKRTTLNINDRLE